MLKIIFFGLTLLTCLISSVAQATVTSEISCESRLSLRNGALLIYQIFGNLEFSDDGQIIGIEQPNLFITIIRREANGQEKLLRNQERLGNFVSDAPDADYSSLPFSRDFKPSNSGSIDSGIYHVSSADYGIYIRMLPTHSVPEQVQIVHYLSQTKFVRSKAFPCFSE